jgi:hypothetical protein
MQTRAPCGAAAHRSRAPALQVRAAMSGTASSRALLRRAAVVAPPPAPPAAGRHRTAVVVGAPASNNNTKPRSVTVSRRAPRPAASSSGAPRR